MSMSTKGGTLLGYKLLMGRTTFYGLGDHLGVLNDVLCSCFVICGENMVSICCEALFWTSWEAIKH